MELCDSVTNSTAGLTWTSRVTKSSPAENELRVVIDTEYKLADPYVGQSLKLVRQVGRNLISVMVTHTAKKSDGITSITKQEEVDLTSLLDIFTAHVQASASE